jgi:hypothetical protein
MMTDTRTDPVVSTHARRTFPAIRLIALGMLLTSCHRTSPNSTNGTASATKSEALPGPGSAQSPFAGTPQGGGGGFAPLGSQPVKDAIHRALDTGETQRWADAGLTGYAVPSKTSDAHGCRAVRYTIDQQPDRTFPVITACDAR